MGIFRRFRTLAADRRRRLVSEKRDLGATAVEYGLILALFGIGMIGVSSVLFGAIQTTMGVQSTNVGNTVAVMVTPPATITGTPACAPGSTWNGTACVATVCPTGQVNQPGVGCVVPVPCPSPSIYNLSTNSCSAPITASPTPTPTGTPTCNVGGWYNPLTTSCEPLAVCVPPQVRNVNTNQCVGATQGNAAACTGGQGWDPALGSCRTQAQCTSPKVWYTGSTPPQCLSTQLACGASGGAWSGSTCTTNAQCASSGLAWIPGSATALPACVTQTQCTNSPRSWFWNTSVSPPACEAPIVCSDPLYPRDAATNTCRATAASCNAGGMYYNSTLNPPRCQPYITCSDPLYPLDTNTNTCRATSASCTAGGMYYNSNVTPPRCDAWIPCTDLRYPVPNSTNTGCMATAAACAANNRYLNTNANPRRCDALPTVDYCRRIRNGTRTLNPFANYTGPTPVTLVPGSLSAGTISGGDEIQVTLTGTGSTTITYTYRYLANPPNGYVTATGSLKIEYGPNNSSPSYPTNGTTCQNP